MESGSRGQNTAVQEQRPKYDSALVPKNIRNLVCQRCWEDLFSTLEYWNACRVDYNEDNVAAGHRAQHRVLPSYAADHKKSCNWCKQVCLYTSLYSIVDRKSKSSVYDISISQGQTFPISFTPPGHNVWSMTIAVSSSSSSRQHNIYVHTGPEDNAAEIITARPRQVVVDTPSAIEQITTWLKACRTHSGCPDQGDVQLPTRLIDLGLEHGPFLPKVCDTNDHYGQYAALSYCWGGEQIGALTQRNLHQYYEAIDINMISQTINDAMRIVNAVGLRYLWVDALCIVQDDAKDKSKEIFNMDQVYASALFTIVAESASSAEQGFLAPRTTPSVYYQIPYRCLNGRFGTMSVYNDEWHPMRAPLAERAWAFQESLLSSRLVVYNSKTMQWYCRGGQYNLGSAFCLVHSRNQPTGNPGPETLLSVGDLDKILTTHTSDVLESWTDLWMRIVSQYSRRKYTISADRIIALSGIAKAVGNVRSSKYLAGLWRDQLLPQLLWRLDSAAPYPRPSEYRAPSWSWASVDGTIVFGTGALGDEYTLTLPPCNIIECEVVPTDVHSPFGALQNGWLVLEAYVRRGHYHFLPESTHEGNIEEDHIEWEGKIQPSQPHSSSTERSEEDCSRWIIGFDIAGLPPAATFDFLVVWSWTGKMWQESSLGSHITGLVLQPLPDDTFERVGTFHGTYYYDERVEFPDFSTDSMKRVKII